jgi:hypothetical protein
MKQVGLKLREAFRDHGTSTGVMMLQEAIKEKKINPDALSIRGLAEGIIGEGFYNCLEQYARDVSYRMNLREQSVVDTSNFVAISGQILINRVIEKYNLEVQTVNDFFPTEQITNGNLQTEKQPIVSRVNDMAMKVNQAMPYPNTTFGTNYIELPAPEKFGLQCNVTAEAVFADRTKAIYDSAASVGEMTGWYEVRDKLRTLLGIKNTYNYNGTAYDTYRTSGSVINKLTTFAMSDWRGMNTLQQTMANQTDPVTGLPIQTDIKDIFVIPASIYGMRRIFNATEVRSAGSVSNDVLISGNPLGFVPNLYTSRYAQRLLIDEALLSLAEATSLVIAGDFRRAFVWRQVWPVTVTQLPPGNEREFNNDIVLSVKASGFGVAAVVEPRYLVYGFTDS